MIVGAFSANFSRFCGEVIVSVLPIESVLFLLKSLMSPHPLWKNVIASLCSESQGPGCLIKSTRIWCVLGKGYKMKLLSKLNVKVRLAPLCCIPLCGLNPQPHQAAHSSATASLCWPRLSHGKIVRSPLEQRMSCEIAPCLFRNRYG